jgi:hypothetical protein
MRDSVPSWDDCGSGGGDDDDKAMKEPECWLAAAAEEVVRATKRATALFLLFSAIWSSSADGP